MSVQPHKRTVLATRRVVLAAAILGLQALCVAYPAVALHSPKEWYGFIPEDSDQNGVADDIDALPPGQQIDVMIAFLGDCRSSTRMLQLATMGTLGYVSTVVTSAELRGVLVSDVRNVIASWPEVGHIHLVSEHEFNMDIAGQALASHTSTLYPSNAEDAGFDGSGVTIAIVDSGVDDTHPDLPAAVGGVMFNGTNGVTVVNPADGQGHGTSMAGAALGRGQDIFGILFDRGVAPGASLFDGRVLAAGSTTPDDAGVQAVLDWININGNTIVPPIRVVNLSIGSESLGSGLGNAVTGSIQALVQRGVVVVVGAGNNDSCAVTPSGAAAGIGAYAAAPDAITVGGASDSNTVDRSDDVISGVSRVGPGIGPQPKPDITAYAGQCNPNPLFCTTNGQSICAGGITSSITTTSNGGGYGNGIGTSEATAMVAGAAALLIEQNPTITAQAVRNALITSAEDRGPAGWDAQWGAGLMDLRPLFPAASPPPPCNLRVKQVTYDPMPVQCFQSVEVTVTVENIGTSAVDNFSVNFERWFLGPNNAPRQRFDIVPAPTQNASGPLNPGQQREFKATWTPGVSDSLPLSAHTCFWGVVDAACDTNASDNERNINATIVGVTGTSCLVAGPIPPDRSTREPIAQSDFSGFLATAGNPLELPFRIGHDDPGGLSVDLALFNPNPGVLHAELDVGGVVDESGLNAYVDNQMCPVDATLRVYYYDPENTPPVELIVDSSSMGSPLGDMSVTVMGSANVPVFTRVGFIAILLGLGALGALRIHRTRSAER